MSNFVMCRVCLSHNVRMLSISNTGYQEMYEKYTGTKLNTKDRPDTICYICNSQLVKFAKFFKMSQKVEGFLTEVHRRNVKLTQETISALDRFNTLHRFSVNTFRSMSIIDQQPSYGVKLIPNENRILTKEIDVILPEDIKDLPPDEIDVLPSDEIEDLPPEDIKDLPPDVIENLPSENLEDLSSEEIEELPSQEIEDLPSKEKEVLLLRTEVLPLHKEVEIIPPVEVLFQNDAVDVEALDCTEDTEIDDVDVKIESVDYKEIDLVDNMCTEDVPISEIMNDKNLTTPSTVLEDDHHEADNGITFGLPANNMEYLIEQNYSIDKKLVVLLERLPMKSITRLTNSKDECKEKKTVNKLTKKQNYFKCKECEYKTPFKSILDKHIKVHDLKRANSCSSCVRQLGTSASHVCTHKATRRLNECLECSKSFKNLVNLQKHMLIHSERKYFCVICDRSYYHRSTYLIHTRIHTGEKPFSCKSCEKTFNNKSNCRKHMKTHTDDAPKMHECVLCNKTFKDISLLRKHAVMHIL